MSATRFPGKPLKDICGKPMIEWVYKRAKQAKNVSQVLVATCDQEIIDVVKGFGGEAVMTSDLHTSGTDRVAEACRDIDVDLVVNVQGDEPLIDPNAIDSIIEPFIIDQNLKMASFMVPISEKEAENPNLVKVVVDINNYALYFSRSPIPFQRKPLSGSIYGHVGLYAYTKDFLQTFASLPPSPLESSECLEQLRVLENGYKLKMVEIQDRPMGVDTEEDLEEVIKIAAGLNID